MSGATFPASVTVAQGNLAPSVSIVPGAWTAPVLGTPLSAAATSVPGALLMEDGGGDVLLEGGGAMLMEAQ